MREHWQMWSWKQNRVWTAKSRSQQLGNLYRTLYEQCEPPVEKKPRPIRRKRKKVWK